MGKMGRRPPSLDRALLELFPEDRTAMTRRSKEFRQGGVASTSEARAEARAQREEEERDFN